jgi:hypothetical protein
MTFDDYQACFNALFAADRQLNLVQARFAASGATLDAFQLLRLAMVQCFERLEQQYARQYPDHELADVCALLEAQRAPEGHRDGALVLQDVLRRPAAETRPHSPQGTTADRQPTALPALVPCSGHGASGGACQPAPGPPGP